MDGEDRVKGTAATSGSPAPAAGEVDGEMGSGGLPSVLDGFTVVEVSDGRRRRTPAAGAPVEGGGADG